jgi:riboflavin kinase / FMN adenylyltransferase
VLLKKVVARAVARRAVPTALAFDMPPRHADKPLATPVLINTLSEKLQLLKSFGIQRVQVLVFNRKTARTSAEDFFHRTILKKHGACEIVVGPKLAFGRGRAGKLPLLKRLAASSQVALHVVRGVDKKGRGVSSRRIRALLSQGNVRAANELLGYFYSAEGKVIHGDHRGRSLGFPTANLSVQPGKIMPQGVYWVKVVSPAIVPRESRELWNAVDGLCNVGFRPTFTPNEKKLHCEVYLLPKGREKTRPLYGRRLRVVFMRKIRAEKRFKSPGALQRQIQQDLRLAKLYRNAHFSI